MRGSAARSIARQRAAGFTLVEMMVAIAILILLSAIIVAFVPNVLEQDRAARGADRLQAALLIARERAVRDRGPRGVRIQPVEVSFRVSSPRQQIGQPDLYLCRLNSPRSGLTEQGWPWTIKIGTPLFITDPDPTDASNPAKFFNSEVVTVLAVDDPSAPAPNFVARFSKPHGPFPGVTQWYNVRLVTYSAEVQYTEVPPDFTVRWTFKPFGVETTRPLEIPPLMAGVPRVSVHLDRTDFFQGPSANPKYLIPPGSPSGNPAVRDFSDNRWFYPTSSGVIISSDNATWPVQAGDYLVIEDNITRRIAAVGTRPLTTDQTYVSTKPSPIVEADTLYLDNPLPDYLFPGYTTNYKILRAPRLLEGETPVAMPFKVAIDLDSNFVYGEPLPINPNNGAIDIVFSPDGSVLATGASNNKIHLWVRDPTADATRPGNQTIISIHVATGLISTHPVDITPLSQTNPTVYADPYSFTRSDRASGL